MDDDGKPFQDEASASSIRQSQQIGRLKLMLRLPAHRARLDEIGAKESALDGLFDAYNAATEMLRRFDLVSQKADEALALEYRKICSEIEADVVRYLDDRVKNQSVHSL